MPHSPTCADKTKTKWVNKRWVNRDRGGGNWYREQWATQECKSCGGNLGDSMVRSGRLRKGAHKKKD